MRKYGKIITVSLSESQFNFINTLEMNTSEVFRVFVNSLQDKRNEAFYAGLLSEKRKKPESRNHANSQAYAKPSDYHLDKMGDNY